MCESLVDPSRCFFGGGGTLGAELEAFLFSPDEELGIGVENLFVSSNLGGSNGSCA